MRDTFRSHNPESAKLVSGRFLNRVGEQLNSNATAVGSAHGQVLSGPISCVNPGAPFIQGVAIVLATSPATLTYDEGNYPLAPWPAKHVYLAKFRYWDGGTVQWLEDDNDTEGYTLDMNPYWQGSPGSVPTTLSQGDVLCCFLDRGRGALIPTSGPSAATGPIYVRIGQAQVLDPGSSCTADVQTRNGAGSYVDATPAQSITIYDPLGHNFGLPTELFQVQYINGRYEVLGSFGLIRKGVVSGGTNGLGIITPNNSGTAHIWWAEFETNPIVSREVFLDWMHSDEPVDVGTEILMEYKPDEQHWWIMNAACGPSSHAATDESSQSSSTSAESSSSSVNSSTSLTSESSLSSQSSSSSSSSSSSGVNATSVSSASTSTSWSSQSWSSDSSSSQSSSSSSSSSTEASLTSQSSQSSSSSSLSSLSSVSSSSSSTFASLTSNSSSSSTFLSLTSNSSSRSSLSSNSSSSSSSTQSSSSSSYSRSSSSTSTSDLQSLGGP